VDLGPAPAQPMSEGECYAASCRVAAFQIQLALDKKQTVVLKPRPAFFIRDALMDMADHNLDKD
jgi:hypothetical protein